MYLKLVVAITLFVATFAAADNNLQSIAIKGDDSIVFDAQSGAYWFPHQTRLVGMTKPEQQAFIDTLNETAYGGLNNWRFATLKEVLALMEAITEGYTEEVSDGSVSRRSPVEPAQYFEPSAPNVNAESTIFCGRTADENVLREDYDRTTVVRWGEGNYHFRWFFNTLTVMFDDDVNYMPDEALQAADFGGNLDPQPEKYYDCGAWLIAFED